MKSFLSLLFTVVLVSGFQMTENSHAAGLKDYKKQKHSKRKRVTSENCESEFIKRCQSECKDDNCRNSCTTEAPTFCKKREKRKFWKTAEVVAKGASVAAGAIGVLLDEDMKEVSADGKGSQVSAFSIIWNRSSWELNLGLGMIEAGGMSATVLSSYRYKWFGAAVNANYLWDGDDHLNEIDMGPTFNFASSSFMYSVQPSLMISDGNGVESEYGFGVRSYTKYIIRRMILFFDPMLGYINSNWQYHARLGATYRFTPTIGASFAYEYRDLVDLGDLDISSSALQGASLYLNFRWN